MTQSLQQHAAAAQDAARSLERMLDASRPQWNDERRHAFDRRHADTLAASGRKVADELTSLADELEAALASLR